MNTHVTPNEKAHVLSFPGDADIAAEMGPVDLTLISEDRAEQAFLFDQEDPLSGPRMIVNATFIVAGTILLGVILWLIVDLMK